MSGPELRKPFHHATKSRSDNNGESAGKPSAGSRRISLRLTTEEHEQLQAWSDGSSISSYVRGCIFNRTKESRRRTRHSPVKDHEPLAEILGRLGQTRISNNLNQIARHANMGTLPLDPDVEQDIKIACAEIAWIKVRLIEALGLKDGDPS